MSKEKNAIMQGHDWAGDMGNKWNRHVEQFERMIAPIGAVTLNFAGLKSGDRVLDIGCGGGATTLDIARAVGSAGRATGIDINKALIATASQRAKAAGLANTGFVCADAASAQLEHNDYNVLFSRFGVMFFEDPFKAFAHMHGFLAQQARLAFCCWGPPPENPWVKDMAAILGRHIEMPPPDPLLPGPFAFADQDRTRAILEQAGFHGVSFTPWRGTQFLGGPGLDAAAALDFCMKALFVGEVLEAQSIDVVAAVQADLLEMFRQRQVAGGIEMAAMVWLVAAQA